MSTDIVEAEIVDDLPGVAIQRHQGDGDVSGLVRLAIEQGVSVEILERLVALQERVTDRNARAAFFEAKSKFQMACPPILKSRKAEIATKSGARFSYSYAPLEEITRTILPHLAEHGLSFSWDVAEVEGKMLAVSCVLRHVDGHEDRATFPVPVDSGGRMSDAQAMGGALTYGRRQSLIAVLGLTTADEDTDGARREPTTTKKLSKEQVADIEALIDEVGVDRGKFLRWLEVNDLSELPATQCARAIKALEAKRGGGA